MTINSKQGGERTAALVCRLFQLVSEQDISKIFMSTQLEYLNGKYRNNTSHFIQPYPPMYYKYDILFTIRNPINCSFTR